MKRMFMSELLIACRLSVCLAVAVGFGYQDLYAQCRGSQSLTQETRANADSFENVAKLMASPPDINLPAWGPYTTRYAGISHIPKEDKGLRFDISVFPGFYRQEVLIPNVRWPSGYHPWNATTNLDYFSNRFQLKWKDEVYSDISFSCVDENTRLIRAVNVNNTDLPQNLVLHYVAYLNYPRNYGYEVVLPDDGIWINPLDYVEMDYAEPRPKKDLTYDGWFPGEARSSDYVNGRALAKGFGRDAGDRVSYRVDLAQSLGDATLLVRYRMKAKGQVDFQLKGTVNVQLDLAPADTFSTAQVSLGQIEEGAHTLTLVSEGGAAIELDGIALVGSEDTWAVRFEQRQRHYEPKIISGPKPNSVLLKYEDVDAYYGLAWNFEGSSGRAEYFSSELDEIMRLNVKYKAPREVVHGEGRGHFLDVYLEPIVLPADTARTIYGIVSAGKRQAVERTLADFLSSSDPASYVPPPQARSANLSPTPAGEKYLFSQKQMAATLLTNVVYPTYTRGSYIKHHTPGRQWMSLYTWDSGFIGLGMAELDLGLAAQVLNTYVTDPGSPWAFVLHGTPVPTQIYLFQELWNRTQSRGFLEYFYPRVRQMHHFLVGRIGSSTTRMPSDLIRTWDYFYNSGGWDDYPPQMYVHKNNLTESAAPVANTVHAIRTAKILSMAAQMLGKEEDVVQYKKDIALLTETLQRYSWDEDSGYYGYVMHDAEGQPTGILQTEDGTNYNMGLGGAYPLVAGITTPTQEERLLNHLTTRGRLWTRIGLTAVDQAAPYYREDGYWNGTVWMPHQWFFWKAMLDLGQSDFAFKISDTALDLWRREVEASYKAFEFFLVETGRGAGWHQFGGLSSPVLSWYGAYYRPGRLTGGFDTWIVRKRFSENNSSLEAELRFYNSGSSGHRTVIATMNSEYAYDVLWKGKPVAYSERAPGLLEIALPGADAEGELLVSRRKGEKN